MLAKRMRVDKNATLNASCANAQVAEEPEIWRQVHSFLFNGVLRPHTPRDSASSIFSPAPHHCFFHAHTTTPPITWRI